MTCMHCVSHVLFFYSLLPPLPRHIGRPYTYKLACRSYFRGFALAAMFVATRLRWVSRWRKLHRRVLGVHRPICRRDGDGCGKCLVFYSSFHSPDDSSSFSLVLLVVLTFLFSVFFLPLFTRLFSSWHLAVAARSARLLTSSGGRPNRRVNDCIA